MNQCQYCEKIFSSKSNLSNHQKTAKFCLNKRNIINEEYKCICKKNFTTKIVFDRHKEICNIFFTNNKIQIYLDQLKLKDEQLKDKDVHIKYLEDKLVNIVYE